MSLWSVIKGWFNVIIKEFRKFLQELFSGTIEIILAKLKKMALEVVQEFADKDLNNEDKRRQACEELKAYAIKEGIDVKDSLINLAIEMAVSYLKKYNQIS